MHAGFVTVVPGFSTVKLVPTVRAVITSGAKTVAVGVVVLHVAPATVAL